jgi:hypothetical protein
MCKNIDGFITISRKDDGSILWVKVQCFGPYELGTSYSSVCLDEGVTFYGFVPDEVEIVVNLGNATISQVFNPEYTLWYPNGPECEPELRLGTVTIEIP